MNAGFSLNLVYQGTPFIGGSLQDASSMTLVYQGAPFVVANQQPGASYVYDSRARLNQAKYTNGQGLAYNLDSMGNRSSVVRS